MTAPDRLVRIKHDDECGLEIGRSDFGWLVGEVERLRNMRSVREVERLRGLLARLEWIRHGDGWPDECPTCRMSREQGHDPGCEWVAVMGERP